MVSRLTLNQVSVGSNPTVPANIEMSTSGKSSGSEPDIPWFESKHLSQTAPMMELVYILDLKSSAQAGLGVRFPLGAPNIVLWRSRLTRCPLKALFMGANPIRMTKIPE